MEEIMFPRKTYGLLYGLKHMEEDALVLHFLSCPSLCTSAVHRSI
jgi:hypothetical protein